MSTPMSVAHAARMSGRSEKTIRRWIASGKLVAQKIDGAFALDQADLARLVGDLSSPGVDTGGDTDVHPQTDMRLDILRAEAMAAYTRSLLEPLVEHVAALEGTVRGQAETIGRQAAELGSYASAVVALSAENDTLRAAHGPGASHLTPDSPDPTPEPFSGRQRVRLYEAATLTTTVLVIVLVIVLLVGSWS